MRNDLNTMKFRFHEVVTHVKTGRKYRIVMLPDACRIEATNEPAYAYQDADDMAAGVWVRPQAEMEDGRFTPEEEDQPGPGAA